MTPHLWATISALERNGCRPKETGAGKWRAHCPGPSHARGDVRPSLGVTGVGDRVLLNCFVCGSAGKAAILRSLGLTYRDLFSASAQQSEPHTKKRRQVAVYSYDAVTGECLAEKLRYEPKAFRWRSPDPDNPGRFISRRLPSVPPYRLPHLIDARVVVIVEGEKAVDRLVAEGIVATCPPSGAMKWPDSYTDALWRAGAERVVVIPDNDSSGRRHGDRVVQACHGYQPASLLPSTTTTAPWTSWPCAEVTDPEVAPLWAAQLTLDDLPYRGDVYDWFEVGHTADELRALLTTAKDSDTMAQEKQEREKRLARDRQRRCRARKRLAVERHTPVTLQPA